MVTGQLAMGQVKQVYRWEEEIKGYEEGYTVISLKQEGLALIHEMEKFSHGNRTWQLEIVDTLLTRTWEKEIDLKKGLILVGYEYSPGHLFLLFREGQNDFHNFTLLSIAFHEETVSEEKVNFELNFKLTHFTMAGNSAVFGGEINGEPAVMLYNQHSDHPDRRCEE